MAEKAPTPTAAKVKSLELEALRMTQAYVAVLDERNAALAENERLLDLAGMVAALEIVRTHGGQETYLRHAMIDVEAVRDLARKLTGQ